MKSPLVSGASSAYKGRSFGDGQEMVNLYAELSGPESKNVANLIGTPGLINHGAIGSGQCRGMYTTARNRMLMVTGNKLYEISPNTYAATQRGVLHTHYGTVSFAEIDKQLDPTAPPVSQVMMVDGFGGYVFNTLTNVFTQVSGDYIAGTSVISQNGFFVQNCNNNNKFIYSNQYDGLTWEASLNFFAAESSPDPILWITIVNNQIWLFGSKTIEIWNFTGDPDQLWVRSGIGFMNFGMAGLQCATVINGHIFWLGSSPQGSNMIWHSGPSYMPERVSTHAIEYQIGQMNSVSDCIAISYQQEGHQFAIFNFPSGNKTYVYDMTTGLWHERGSYDVMTGLNNRHRAAYLTNWNDKVYVGDTNNGNLYEWSLDQYTDDGVTIKRERTAPHIHDDRQRLFFHSLEVDCERGVGLQSGQGSDPQMMLKISNDGGFTYSPLEMWATAGKVGTRFTRVKWNKLGMSRDRVFRLTMTDPVKWIIIDARMSVTEEPVK